MLHTYWKPMGVALVLTLTFGLMAAALAQEEDAKMIADGTTVSLEYTLTDEGGQLVDTNVGKDALVYVQGEGKILPALERALTGLKKGDSKEVQLSAEEGYGPYRPEGVMEVPLERLPEDGRTVGTVLAARDDSGNTVPVRVTEVREEVAIVDWNHPLAGESLNFQVTVLGVE